MGALRGLVGLAFLLLVAVAFSRHRRGISLRTVAAALGLQVGFGLVLLLLSWGFSRVNVNRFSMHGAYRNRLIRTFLGASRGAVRKPNPFTGFDSFDNVQMHELQGGLLRECLGRRAIGAATGQSQHGRLLERNARHDRAARGRDRRRVVRPQAGVWNAGNRGGGLLLLRIGNACHAGTACERQGANRDRQQTGRTSDGHPADVDLILGRR